MLAVKRNPSVDKKNMTDKLNNFTLILASASPRRADLLRAAGLEFTVRIADIDETQLANESPSAYVERLSRQKAQAVAQKRAHLETPDHQTPHERDLHRRRLGDRFCDISLPARSQRNLALIPGWLRAHLRGHFRANMR